MEKLNKATYKYNDLCLFFEENQFKNGGSKHRQFERWRKNYNIEKVPNKNEYILYELTKVELNNEQKYFSYQQYIEPMLYKLLLKSKEENHKINYSITDLMYALYLVNSDYKYAKYNQKDFSELLTGTYDLELDDYMYETYKMIKRIILKILDSMVKKDMIHYTKILMKANKYFSNGEYFTKIQEMSNKEIQSLITLRSNLSVINGEQKEFLKLPYYKRKEINKKIAEEMNISYYFETFEIVINKEGLARTIKNNSYSYNQLGIIINNNMQIKINKSLQGDLKNIIKENKELYTDALINRNKDYKLREKIKNGK